MAIILNKENMLKADRIQVQTRCSVENFERKLVKGIRSISRKVDEVIDNAFYTFLKHQSRVRKVELDLMNDLREKLIIGVKDLDKKIFKFSQETSFIVRPLEHTQDKW